MKIPTSYPKIQRKLTSCGNVECTPCAIKMNITTGGRRRDEMWGEIPRVSSEVGEIMLVVNRRLIY